MPVEVAYGETEVETSQRKGVEELNKAMMIFSKYGFVDYGGSHREIHHMGRAQTFLQCVTGSHQHQFSYFDGSCCGVFLGSDIPKIFDVKNSEFRKMAIAVAEEISKACDDKLIRVEL